jgi:DNA cross-link repair 1A protein
MGHLRFDRMRALLKSSNGRYTAVVGFRPTGWVATSSTAGGTAAGRTLRAGPLQLYELPYSEHSSFAELQACVRQLKPRLIVPTVGSAADTRAQVAMLQEPGAAPVQAATLGHPAPG